MFETPLNQKTVALKLKRIEICDLLLACTSVSTALHDEGRNAEKWDALHEKLNQILVDFDKTQGY